MRNSAAPASKKVFPIALSLIAQITSQPWISYLWTFKQWIKWQTDYLKRIRLLATQLEARQVSFQKLQIRDPRLLNLSNLLMLLNIYIRNPFKKKKISSWQVILSHQHNLDWTRAGCVGRHIKFVITTLWYLQLPMVKKMCILARLPTAKKRNLDLVCTTWNMNW